ncbi:MAG: SAF domain-containing protein [Haloferacaceae archaeon]
MLIRKLEARDEPVRVGLVGAGMFGSQVAYAVESTPGMTVAAIADIDRSKAFGTFERAGVPESTVETGSSAAAAAQAMEAGDRLVLDDGLDLIEAGPDVLVEATGVPEVAARHAYAAIDAGVDVVNVSVEADTVVGPLLGRLAERAGVTYSMAYGDQPAKVIELYDRARTNGFGVVAAGRTAGDLEPHGTPDDALERHRWIGPFVEEYDPDPAIYNSFLDGTKVAVESCAIANALGLRPDRTGMHVPEVSRADAPAALCPTADGGRLDAEGVIDCLTLTDEGFSGFVVTRTDNESLRRYLHRRGSVPTAADGRYQLFHVPFHDAQETSVSVARAALSGEPTGRVRSQETEVVAAAKRDLRPGDEIDGGGGYTVYGVLEDADVASERGHVPLELLAGATVRAEVGVDEFVSEDDVDLDTDSFLYHLRRVQEGVAPAP